jgi:CHAT domain-containing protein
MWMDSTSVAMSLLENRLEPLRDRVSVGVAVQLDRMRGELLLKAGRTGAALECLRRAEAVAAPRGISFRAGPIALMGRCLARLGRPDSALAVLSRAAHVWEEERSRSRDPEWREQLGVDARLLYTALAEQLLQTSGGTHEEAPVRAAFDALQRFKTRTLLERMFGSAAAGRPTVGVDELQRSVLGEGELLVDTFSGTDAVFVFFVDRETCRGLRIPDSRDIQERIRSYRLLTIGESGRVTDPDRARFLARAGRSLSVELLGPAADLLRSRRRILFALDGPLNLIPTGTLVFPDDAGEPLLSSAEVVQVPSATVLAGLRAPSESAARVTARPRILAVSGRGADDEIPLPGAAAEVEWLCRRYRGVQGGMATGGPADSAEIPDLARYEVLHFAGHTRLDDPAPWRSAITLPSAARGGADSILRAGTIATMRLSARVTVLSGCESAGGPVTSGEGVLGLTSAFIAAGVPAVIATQWPVDDIVTTRIVRGFYRRLDEGKTVAEALRGAQNAIRGDPRTADPFYWAGFTVVGEGDSRMRLPRRPLLLRGGAYPYLVAACLGLFALDVMQRRRSRSQRRESM